MLRNAADEREAATRKKKKLPALFRAGASSQMSAYLFDFIGLTAGGKSASRESRLSHTEPSVTQSDGCFDGGRAPGGRCQVFQVGEGIKSRARLPAAVRV